MGIPKGNVHQSLGAPQEEHLAAQAKEPSCLPPACQEPPSQSRAEPCTAHNICRSSPCALRNFLIWSSPLQGSKSLPFELSCHSAMQPSLQLCCYRLDSGHPAPVTSLMSQMFRFLTWETSFATCCLKLASAASHSQRWGMQGYLLQSSVPTGTTILDLCFVISQL